ncbi:MAG: RNA methyltransferase [Burkholderiaceae bacterium]|nr:RNA methyltransferase [Burkholderiaceae bacterium]
MSHEHLAGLALKRITSKENPEFRRLLAVQGQADVRRAEGVCWLEGPRLIQQFLLAFKQAKEHPQAPFQWQCDTLVFSEDWLQGQASQPLWQPLLEELSCLMTHALVMPDHLFARLAETSSPAGLGLLIASGLAHDEPLVESDRALARACETGDGLVLDAIQDPGNLGTLLRTAAAAGTCWVAFTQGSADPFSPKCLRAGLGAQFVLQLFPQQTPEALVSVLKASGVDLFAADPLLGQSLFAEPASQRLGRPASLAWVFGQEGRGLSEYWRTQPDIGKVFIPQSSSMESLNVAAAAAVCLFERRRCLMAS